MITFKKNLRPLDRGNGQTLLKKETTHLTEKTESSFNFDGIIGESAGIKKTLQLVEQVSNSNSTVLLLGETGTGKELVARAIHMNSPRKNKPMIKVNCAAMPVHLIESELFGHERGSFTGATERRIGKFEMANHGTLFLDEIGEMPLDLQVKLLRVLQEKEIERVGGKGTIKINVRIIAATNRDLKKDVKDGLFRSDLYYRLHVFPLIIPPLRERKDDISSLVHFFINKYAGHVGRGVTSISFKATRQLHAYTWPGNIRELEHVIERSILLADTWQIKEVDLPVDELPEESVNEFGSPPFNSIIENERKHILNALKLTKGKMSGYGGAAGLLGIPYSTLASKMKKTRN